MSECETFQHYLIFTIKRGIKIKIKINELTVWHNVLLCILIHIENMTF